MKKLLFLICLSALMVTGLNAKAQEITITLQPGWTWISYTNAEAMDIAAALGDFVPMVGDIIKSQEAAVRYQNNGVWRGGFEQFIPGKGYHYYSNRTEDVSFVFAGIAAPVVTVITSEPADVTATSAVVGGTVDVPEGGHVFMRGVCWGTEPTPTINGNTTDEGTGTGSFSSTLEGLSSNTVYYVRAYAVSDFGLAYGDVLLFVAADEAPTGAINGKFTINDNGDQVYFAQGNLQYIGSASTPYWKFAENQWDYLGTTTGQNSSSQNVDRDLFGWGTSGWNSGNTCYQPWDTYGTFGSSYGPVGGNNLTGTYANSDWGVYNPISNGGGQPDQWRTLNKDEWVYVFNTRTTESGIRFAKANVNDVNGVILLPDYWNSSYYELSETNNIAASFSSNILTASEWNILERIGAVFLPSAGNRFETSVKQAGNKGYYWSSTSVNATYAYGVYIDDTNLNPQDASHRTYGRSVRLVYVVE
jgi:hypothetical protein